jgi:hypothetical protein
MGRDGRGASLLEADGKASITKSATQFAYPPPKGAAAPQAGGVLESGN